MLCLLKAYFIYLPSTYLQYNKLVYLKILPVFTKYKQWMHYNIEYL